MSNENSMIFANVFRRSICDLDFHNTRLFPAKQCDSTGNRSDTHNVMSSKAFDERLVFYYEVKKLESRSNLSFFSHRMKFL